MLRKIKLVLNDDVNQNQEIDQLFRLLRHYYIPVEHDQDNARLTITFDDDRVKVGRLRQPRKPKKLYFNDMTVTYGELKEWRKLFEDADIYRGYPVKKKDFERLLKFHRDNKSPDDARFFIPLHGLDKLNQP